ncbi:MAG TPA: circadian clock KaiB family protein [Methanocella sp.]|nr:circadian clock KaiB family protein [Methanocella sp.]
MKQDTVEQETWDLKIYVAGETEKSRKAVENLRKVCDEHLKGKCHIEVIDLVKNPRLAAEEQIFAVPTVIRKLPEPLKRLIGDMSATEHVLVGLDIKTKK